MAPFKQSHPPTPCPPHTHTHTYTHTQPRRPPHTSKISGGLFDYKWHVSDCHSLNGTFIDCVKVSDSEIHDGETLTLGGGAGLQPGERSDLLASDLVFRFELVDEAHAASLGVTPAAAEQPVVSLAGAGGVGGAAGGGGDGSAAVVGGNVATNNVPVVPGANKPSNLVPPSPMQEGEGKEGDDDDDDDDDDESMLGAGSSSNSDSRKRRVSAGGADSKRRKVDDSVHAATNSTSTSSTSGAAASSSSNSSTSAKSGSSSQSVAPVPVQPSPNQRFSSLKAELKCAVCYDFFFNACTLECSHSFCQPCVEEWLHKKHECPVCRTAVEAPPNRSNHLDNMVQKLMDNDERIAFERRKRVHGDKMKRQHKALESLSKRLEEASAKNEKFLSIKDEWTQGNKATFEQGVNQYRGNAREQYCDAIGLTRGFVEMSPREDLMRAAVNVGLVHQGDTAEHPNLRKRMHMFISYG